MFDGLIGCILMILGALAALGCMAHGHIYGGAGIAFTGLVSGAIAIVWDHHGV